FEDITIQSDSGYAIQNETAGSGAQIRLNFTDCIFTGNGNYFNANVMELTLVGCDIDCDTSAAIIWEGALDVDNCRFTAGNSSGTTIIFAATGDGFFDSYYSARDSSFSGAFFGTGGQLLPTFYDIGTIERCSFL